MPGGRPTEYGLKILTKAKDYLTNYKVYGDAIPSIAGLAVRLKISRSTVYDWAKHEDKKEFSYILDHILSDQERVLINKGLTNEFNSNITKLALGKHGYSDKSETDLTSKGEKIGEPTERILELASRLNDAYKNK
jgi:hypothetical protein